MVDSDGSVELREHGLQLREGDRVITREPLDSCGMEDFLQLCHISMVHWRAQWEQVNLTVLQLMNMFNKVVPGINYNPRT